MKIELKYFGMVLLVFIFLWSTVLLLLKKFSAHTLEHFIETCQQIIPTFWSSNTHLVSALLILLLSIMTSIILFKSFFSIIKTRRKINFLFKYKLDTLPHKLTIVLNNLDINKNKVILVDKETDYAFSYGIKSKVIVLSRGLVEKLDAKQLEAVVLHEKYHLKNNHTLLLLASEIVSSSLFFFPIIKEFVKRMRVVFEEQADLFVERYQKENIHLRKALLKVPNSNVAFYPNFSMRKKNNVSKGSIFVSLLTLFVAFSLFAHPVNTHATEINYSENNECEQNQCRTNCETEYQSKLQNMSLLTE